MKVLYVDIETGGHHQTYLKALMDIPGKENVLVLKKVLNMAIQRTNYTYDEKANAYKNKLSINEFKKQYCKLYF